MCVMFQSLGGPLQTRKVSSSSVAQKHTQSPSATVKISPTFGIATLIFWMMDYFSKKMFLYNLTRKSVFVVIAF